jgi:hypothetical protein
MADPKNAPEDDASERKGRERSPNYPSIGFRSALDLTRKLYDAEKRNPMPRELAAKHLGYGGLNGRSKMVLSALRKFGLVDATADDRMRLSDDAYALMIMPPEDAQRGEVIRRLALRPQIYQDLLAEYQDGLPSDANLRTNLVLRKKFTEQAADAFIEAFRETMNEVNGLPVQAKVDDSQKKIGDSTLYELGFGPRVEAEANRQAVAGTAKASGDGGTRLPSVDLQHFNLGDGVRAELRIVGTSSKKHYKKLIRLIEISYDLDSEEEINPLS